MRRGYHQAASGSSPRLRGPLQKSHHGPIRCRFIPAPAGNTAAPGAGDGRRSVHPRACGEHEHDWSSHASDAGSSPRLRGTRAALRERAGKKRFIPAPAGNTPTVQHPSAPVPVHPRACGEHAATAIPIRTGDGSSPRLRGTRANVCWLQVRPRFIPAPAGNTSLRLAMAVVVCGSSPRLRGTPGRAQPGTPPRRFIPAPAGNTVAPRGCARPIPVHPRACGEHTTDSRMQTSINGSSPRLRGTLQVRASDFLACRFIPAPAGNTRSPIGQHSITAVHPRACGEHAPIGTGSDPPTGSSPRLRGTPDTRGFLRGD